MHVHARLRACMVHSQIHACSLDAAPSHCLTLTQSACQWKFVCEITNSPGQPELIQSLESKKNDSKNVFFNFVMTGLPARRNSDQPRRPRRDWRDLGHRDDAAVRAAELSCPRWYSIHHGEMYLHGGCAFCQNVTRERLLSCTHHANDGDKFLLSDDSGRKFHSGYASTLEKYCHWCRIFRYAYDLTNCASFVVCKPSCFVWSQSVSDMYQKVSSRAKKRFQSNHSCAPDACSTVRKKNH